MKDSLEKILIVDDTEANSNLLAQIIRAEGFEVTIASSGREALEILKHSRPDFIISDLNMPDIDGYKLVTNIRERDKETPFLLYTTGSNHPGLANLAQRLGVSDFISNSSIREIANAAIERLSRAVSNDTIAINKMLKIAPTV